MAKVIAEHRVPFTDVVITITESVTSNGWFSVTRRVGPVDGLTYGPPYLSCGRENLEKARNTANELWKDVVIRRDAALA